MRSRGAGARQTRLPQPSCARAFGAAARARRRSSCARSRLYFQLANIAEQHHRRRRRRDYAGEGRIARESLAEAFELLESVDEAELRDAVGRLSVELVLTAHPTEAARRTTLVAHSRIAALLAESRCGRGRRRPAGRGGDAALADRRGAVAPAAGRRGDPAGPLVRRAEPLGCRARPAARAARARPGRAGRASLRDVDRRRSGRQPACRRRTRSRRRSTARDCSRASCSRPRSAASRSPGGSRRSVVAVERRASAPVPLDPERNTDEPYRRHLTWLWERLARGLDRGRRARAGAGAARRRPARRPRRAGGRRRPRGAPPPRGDRSASTSGARAARARERGPRARRPRARDARRRRARRRRGTAGALAHADHLDDATRPTDVPPPRRWPRGGARRGRRCRCSRRSTTCAPAPALVAELLDARPRDAARGDGRLLRLGQGRRLSDGAVGGLPLPGALASLAGASTASS